MMLNKITEIVEQTQIISTITLTIDINEDDIPSIIVFWPYENEVTATGLILQDAYLV